MTQLSTFGGVIVPTPTDGATIPAAFLSIVNQLCGALGSPARVNAVVGSQAERDANFSGYPAGGLVICPPSRTVWMSLGKTGTVQSWTTLYSDSGWVTSGFAYGEGWAQFSTNSVRVRRKGPMFHLRVAVSWNGSAAVPGAILANTPSQTYPGNIVDQPILTQAPSDYLPIEDVRGIMTSTYTFGPAVFNSAGVLNLTNLNTASSIEIGRGIAGEFTWLAND